MSETETLTVTVRYGDLAAEFKGPPEIVLISVQSFIVKHIPQLDLARKISVSYGLAELTNMFQDLIKMTPEGPRVWFVDVDLSDKEIVGLQLVAAKIAHESGKTDKVALSPAELQSNTGLNAKSISSRISEMSKTGYVMKESSESGVRYRITTQGITWLHQLLSKKTVR